MSYPQVALEDIAEVRLGRQRSPRNHAGTEMRPYVRAANIGWAGWQLDDVKSMNFTDKEMETYRLRSGDLLLGEASGSAHEVGKPALWEGQIDDCAFQNTLIRVRPSEAADPRYLLRYFGYCAAVGHFARSSRGVGIYHLGSKTLARWEVPLPPIDEQRRIAAVLDAADALRGKRREALSKVDILIQAIFMDMFGDPASNPMGWPEAHLGELLDRIDSGKSPTCHDRQADSGEWGVLKAGAVSLGVYDPHENKALPDAVMPDTRHEVKAGDILFSRKNTHDLVATTAFVHSTPPRLLMSDLIFRLVVADSDVVDARFLQAQLAVPRKKREMQSLAAGTSGSMPNISKSKVRSVPVTLPPPELQRRFSACLRSMEAAMATSTRARERLDALFASLEQRAFRGEL